MVNPVPERPPYCGREVLNESALPALEKYFVANAVNDSIDTVFDLPVALSILRLYVFFPHLYNADVVSHILGMALGEAAHEAVFVSCRCLLQDVSSVTALIGLAELLDGARFSVFWREYKKLPAAPWRHDALVAKIRRNIFDTVARTFDSVKLDVISAYLDLSGAELTAYLGTKEVTVDGNIARIPRAKYPNQTLGATTQSTGPTLPSVATIAAVLASIKE